MSRPCVDTNEWYQSNLHCQWWQGTTPCKYMFLVQTTKPLEVASELGYNNFVCVGLWTVSMTALSQKLTKSMSKRCLIWGHMPQQLGTVLHHPKIEHHSVVRSILCSLPLVSELDGKFVAHTCIWGYFCSMPIMCPSIWLHYWSQFWVHSRC